MRVSWAAPIVLSIALSGCGAVGAIGLHPFNKKDAQAVTDITPAPVAPVETADLPPAGDSTGSTGPNSASALADNNLGTPPTANGAPLAAGVDVSRTDLLGGWTLTSGSDSCQLFMTLTSWTGGYRASTRGCNSNALKGIAAWNIDGKQVVLSGAGGAPVAQLAAASQGRFEGQIVGSGGTVSFYR